MSSLTTGKMREMREHGRDHIQHRGWRFYTRGGGAIAQERCDEDVNTKAGDVSTSDTIRGNKEQGRAFRAGNGKGWERMTVNVDAPDGVASECAEQELTEQRAKCRGCSAFGGL